MPGKYFVEIGRVAVIDKGPDAGKAAAIVDIIDQNRALVDGPSSGVRRQAVQFKNVRLTKFKLRIPHGTSTRTVRKAWEKDAINAKFAETTLFKRNVANARKQELNDFDRFKLYKTKQRLNKLVQTRFEKLKAASKKARSKKATTDKAVKKPAAKGAKKPAVAKKAAKPAAAPKPAKK